MKGFILSIMLLAGCQAFALDPTASFVSETLIRGRQILEVKDESDRTLQMCALLKNRIGAEHISAVWLGTFATLTRDQAAIQQFTSIVPSIMITKAIPVMGAGGKDGSFEVNEAALDRGNGIFDVAITVKSNGKSYNGIVVVSQAGLSFKLIDVIYQNFSAVDYQGREYQKFLNRVYNKDPMNSLPVTALVQNITLQSDYINCP